MHGGKTPRGMESALFKNGRHSRYLPTRLAEQYQTARGDPDLLSLRDDISLLDVRLGEMVAALDTGESKATWKALTVVWEGFATEWQDMAPSDMERNVNQITDLVRRGLSEAYTWDEIRGLIKQRADLVANERQRLVQLQQMITSEQAMVLMASIVDIVKRNVRDRSALAAISTELAQLALQPGR